MSEVSTSNTIWKPTDNRLTNAPTQLSMQVQLPKASIGAEVLQGITALCMQSDKTPLHLK